MHKPATTMYILLCLVLSLSACAPPPRVEVVERDVLTVRAETEKIGGAIIRIVQPGDTLHGIAFGTGLNVNQLAAWNRLSDTSRLRVGQQIRLTKPLNFKNTPKADVVAKTQPNQSPKKPQINKPAASSRDTPSVAAKPVSRTQAKIAKATPRWSWPVRGQVIEKFSPSQGRQGVDIMAKRGQAVVASGAGEVVYTGAGLKGYGNLVIIKHNDQFLSAYAHNLETFVNEGQMVPARHKIGSIGVDKKGRQAMHFQIRRDGKPVNPLAYLPGR